MNKYSEKIEEMKKEVEYFNNYLKDPKRLQLPEHLGSAKKTPAGEGTPPSVHSVAIGGGFRGPPFGGGPYGSLRGRQKFQIPWIYREL